MKDQLITIIEALRVSRAELRTHDARRVKNGPRTIQRLKEVLLDASVTQAWRRQALFLLRATHLATSAYDVTVTTAIVGERRQMSQRTSRSAL
jgi:hypothetical protein